MPRAYIPFTRVLLLFLFFASVCASQGWQQQEFIIGALNDPSCYFIRPDGWQYGDTPLAKHLAWLRDYRNANFNLVTGMPAHTTRTFHQNTYKLDVVHRVGGLKSLVDDWIIRITETQAGSAGKTLSDVAVEVGKYKNELPQDLKSCLYGYMVKDEPRYINLQSGKWDGDNVQAVAQSDPARLTYVNLFSNRVGNVNDPADGFWNYWHSGPHGFAPKYYFGAHFPRTRYENHFDNAVSLGAQVLSFDNYCFMKGSNGRVYLRDKFFLNNQIAAEKSRQHAAPFWGMVLSNESYHQRTGAGITWEHDGPADYRTHFTRSQLMWHAHVPVIYGAKGIIWYTYCPLPDNDGPWYNENYALVEIQDNEQPRWEPDYLWRRPENLPRVDENHTYGQGPNGRPIYTWVKEINGTLKNMGPSIMRLEWLGTYHGNTANNWKSIVPYSRVNENSTTIEYLVNNFSEHYETDLPVLSDQAIPVISSFGESPDNNLKTIAAGVFKDANNTRYLMVMNKDVAVDQNDPVPAFRTYTINLVNQAPVVWKHNKTNRFWTKMYNATSSIQLTLAPGDMELLALGTPPNATDLSPILNLLLLD